MLCCAVAAGKVRLSDKSPWAGRSHHLLSVKSYSMGLRGPVRVRALGERAGKGKLLLLSLPEVNHTSALVPSSKPSHTSRGSSRKDENTTFHQRWQSSEGHVAQAK